ncbi:MAG: T9SS type A sorting domain-containing protein [Saprospirales bacterium]|nr:T9SS type A sorting domain-containing protein [Saprospirales bacterium]
MADWILLPEVTDGLVFVDDSAGGYDHGYLVFSGGLGNPAGIFQEIDLEEEPYINIEYNRRNISGEQLPSGSKLEFSLYSDPDGTDQQLIYTDPIEVSADTGWVSRSVSLELSPNPDFPYLVVSLSNDGAGSNSVIALDNLELCSSSDPLGNDMPAKPSPIFRLFPNPSRDEITIEWKGLDVKRGSVQIIGSLGQVLLSMPIKEGSERLTTSVDGLPEGIYFVKILSGRKSLKVMKFVKS